MGVHEGGHIVVGWMIRVAIRVKLRGRIRV